MNGPFSIVMLVYQRVHKWQIEFLSTYVPSVGPDPCFGKLLILALLMFGSKMDGI